MLKVETINQFGGFGNDVPLSGSEYFRSMGMSKGPNGILASRYIYSWKTDSDYADFTLNSITAFGSGKGIAVGSTAVNNYVFMNEGNGHILQSLNGVLTPEVPHRSSQNQNGRGLQVDQKGRLLYFNRRYLGMFDPTVSNYKTGTVSVTNGSATVTGSGTTFTSAMVGKIFRIDSEDIFYKISAFVSTTQITLSNNYSGTTASGSAYTINVAWTDKWKDFGADMVGPARGTGSGYCASEVYEDTVLIGRNNKIVTLNTLTDAITTDAVPALEFPTKFDIFYIHKGSTGILIGGEMQGKTQLVLWDNFSDRSIAPWIEIDEPLVTVSKWDGAWIVVTTRGIYYTNGYSLQTIAENILDTTNTPMTYGATYPNNSFVDGNKLYFGQPMSNYGKRRGGLYMFDLKKRTFEFLPLQSLDLWTGDITAIYKVDLFNRILVGASGLGYITSSPATVCNYITHPVGRGSNTKITEGLKIPLYIDDKYLLYNKAISFDIVAKISPMDKGIKRYAQVKTTMTAYNTVIVNGTTWDAPDVGDEIEFLQGNNAGHSRNIITITGGGTATMTLTLDRDLPAYSSASDNFIFTSFLLINIKSYSSVGEIPKDVYFGIRNKIKARKFMIKLEIINSNTPMEILPFQFIYDDKGVIE